MIDEATNQPLQVETHELAGASIDVSLDMSDKVQKLLQKHDVPHWVTHLAISVDGSPMMVVIHLRRKVNPQAVQELLDRTT